MDDWIAWFRERLGALGLVSLASLSGFWWWQGRPLSQGPGILAPEDPVQTAPESREPWDFRDHHFTALADFSIKARVLSAERYRFDRAAQLSPVDLALGWGPMSDSRILDAFTIHQAERWYFWRSSHMPITEGDVICHSANMHMIPADGGVARTLLSVKEGELVALTGKLVRVDGKDDWHWVSSVTRADTGDGSCEVVWVDSITVADH